MVVNTKTHNNNILAQTNTLSQHNIDIIILTKLRVKSLNNAESTEIT